MRLTPDQIEAIKQETERFFGASAQVWLFGSRVDDAASELQAAILNRALLAADRLVEILHHLEKFAARYRHD
jgi:hypothetical protein